MSEQVAYEGRLTPIALRGEELDRWIQAKLGWSDLNDYYDDWPEAITDELHEHYVFDSARGILYEMERQKLDPGSFVHATRDPDGGFSFLVSYYNGGVGFDEVIDSIFEG